MIVLKADHLGCDLTSGLAVVDAADVSDCGMAAGGFNGHTDDVLDLSGQAVRLRVMYLSNHGPKHAELSSL